MKKVSLKNKVLAGAAFSFAMIASPALAQVDHAMLQTVATDAIALLETHDVDAAVEQFGEPPFFDRATGLHVWSLTDDGVIVFDVSEQTSPGDDISGLEFADGTDVTREILDTVDDGTHTITWDGQVPHATTGLLTTALLWCDRADDALGAASGAVVCAMAWED